MKSSLKTLVLSFALLASASAFAQEAPAPEQAASGDNSEQTAADSQSPEPQEAPAPAASAAPAANGAIGTPPEGKGQIVFFREKKFAGSAIKFKVREGSTELGKLVSGTYFVLPVEPGAHEYNVHSEAKDVLNLEVEAGETYYVSSGITMGFMAGRPNLAPSDQATFDGMKSKLRRLPPLAD